MLFGVDQDGLNVLSLTKLYTGTWGVFLTLDPWLFLEHLLKKTCNCTFFICPFEKCKSFFLLLLFLFFSSFFKNWSTVDLQSCVSFRYTAKWFSYTYICICIFFRFFSIIGYYKILNIVPYSCCLSILYTIVCIC